MLINFVCKSCHVTKKAIEYYEKQGLIHPKQEENGYRNFSEQDILLIKEIALLRKLDLALLEIKEIIFAKNKQKALALCIEKKQNRISQLKIQEDCLKLLIENGMDDVKSLDLIEKALDKNRSIKEKLREAFPGNYGLYLELHFGKFLNEKIETKEKTEAYYKIVDFLDRVKIEMPEELEDFLFKSLEALNKNDLVKLDQSIEKILADPEVYIDNHGEEMKDYVNYLDSQAFKETPLFKMKQIMSTFQKERGYEEFIANLEKVSDSYKDYARDLRSANAAFNEKLLRYFLK